MFRNINIKYFFYRLFYALYPWIAKFDHFSCVCKDNMIVLPVKIGFFILGLILAKLMFSYQSTIQKQFYSVVERCPAHAVFLIFHFNVE